MDHATAMKEYAVERYLLGEMPDHEQDAFEQHYFACAECADDVRAASLFLENLKAVAAQEPTVVRAREPGRRDWFGWLRWQFVHPALTAALLVTTCYLGFIRLPDLERAPVVTVPVMLGVRGTGSETPLDSGKNNERVQIDAKLKAWAPRYQVEVRPLAGGKTIRFDVDGPANSDQLNLKFPVPASLSPGEYELTMRWGKDESASTTFQLTTK
jgi:hypothetical protein